MSQVNNLLPEIVRNNIDKAVASISTISPELWDDSANYLIECLKEKVEQKRKHYLFGAKFIADVQEHINKSESRSAYRVVRQDN